MAEAHIPRSPTTGPTPGQTRDTRARAWAFVFDCHANKNAVGVDSTNGDDAKGSENDRAKESIPETY